MITIIIMFHILVALLQVSVISSVSAAETLPVIEVLGSDLGKGAGSRYFPEAPESGTARILGGKKTSSTQLQDRPALVDQSSRQAFAEIPGLNVAEVSNQSFMSMSFRGLGDPHESFNVQVLEDGIPISADPYGYPANYYAPPFAGLEAVDFFRGGSSLLYGPQPGGALDYRTRLLSPSTKLGARTQQSWGSFGFFSSFNEVSVPTSVAAFRGTYHRRQSKGFRDFNQDFGVDYAQFKAAKLFGMTVATAKLDFYSADHGEPGGLARSSSPGVLGIDQGPNQVSLRNDRLQIRRWGWLLLTETELGSGTAWVNRFFGASYDRNSFRQNLGGASIFGGIPLAAANTIQSQDFTNFGVDSRYLRRLEFLGSGTRWSLGFFGFSSGSRFDQSTGASAVARSGTPTRGLDRSSRALSVFTEVEAQIGRWKLVPGIRVEGIHQSVREDLNSSDPTNLRSRIKTNWVPLGGLGAERAFESGWKAYGNLSQGFRPVLFAEAVPLSPGVTIADDLRPARTLSVEAGVRSASNGRLRWDASAFHIVYDNQIGRVGSVFQNTGSGRHVGVDLAIDYDLGRVLVPGQFVMHANLTLLNARFTGGALSGLFPSYAPGALGRVRLEHRLGDRYRWSLVANGATLQYGDDGNTADQVIPGYAVWDLLAEADLLGGLSLMFSAQNLFDRSYWSRVRPNGIDPAAPRTFQVGLRYLW